MQRKKVFWPVKLHSYLCNALSLYHNLEQLMFFKNIFWNQKHVTNQFKQERNSFVKNYLCKVKVFDQSRKYAEVQNQRIGHPADFTVTRQDNQMQPPELLYKRAILKHFAISTGNTCIAVYWRPSHQQKRPQHRCFPMNIAKFLILPILKNT